MLNDEVKFVSQETSIGEAVKLMINSNISSVLVTDDQENVTGILTERDIVRRFTLLDVEEKLDHAVNTITTRPVIFVSAGKFEKEAVELYRDKGLRHFPVLRGKDPKIKNIAGIISVTDILTAQLDGEIDHSSSDEKSEKDNSGELSGNNRVIGVYSKTPDISKEYKKKFSEFGFEVKVISDLNKFLREDNKDFSMPLLFDLDKYAEKEMKNLLSVISAYPGDLIAASSNASLVSVMRKFQRKNNRTIAMKPLDFTYLAWLLANKWVEDKKSA